MASASGGVDGGRGEDISVELTRVEDIKVRCSSCLGGSKKKHGPKLALDASKPEGSWSSEAGESHWVEIRLRRHTAPTHLHVQFQGGFGANEIELYVSTDAGEAALADESDWLPGCTVFPTEVATEQVLAVGPFEAAVGRMRLVFKGLGDFYGRMVVYRLALFGSVIQKKGTDSAAPVEEASPTRAPAEGGADGASVER